MFSRSVPSKSPTFWETTAIERRYERTSQYCIACCWDFIVDFPLKLETRIGNGGIRLSGGQSQCLAIARALVVEPALLILDEATSALDAETQRKVAANISAEQRRLGFTVVQIAHRLETLRDSDVIFYFQNGHIVEVGGEDTLDHSAVEELLRRRIETKRAPDFDHPGETIDVTTSGFFRKMWETAHRSSEPAPKASKCMRLEQLEDEVKALQGKIDAARAQIAAKARARRLRVRLQAVVRLLRREC